MVNSDLIINFTPTGMIPTKDMTPHVPISPNEIIEDIHKACEVGITMVHVHARDEKTGVPTYKAEVYKKIIEGIRKFSKDLVVCVSLSGRNFKEFEQRSEPLCLDGTCKPDMGSLTLSSLNFNQTESVNSPKMIQRLAETMKEKGIKVELEAFDAGMINYAKYLITKKLLDPPHYFNLLLGNIACAQADLLHAGMMVNDLPENSLWSFAGIGSYQFSMNSAAIAFGGGVRIGLEDNIWYDKQRTMLATNVSLLERIHFIAEANGRSVMPSSQFREIMLMNNGDGVYGYNPSDILNKGGESE
ncbi:3-keto-5-aminohexanoate cleavage protein [Candidatus Omnitrophota bacterium]